MSSPDTFDAWIQGGSLAAALVCRQPLIPVDGPDGVFFPPTYAPSEDRDGFRGGYNIDTAPDGSNVALVDSVGSQANRIEPLFKEEGYRALVPQIEVNVGDQVVSLLDVGHRAGDALVRCSSLADTLARAFAALAKGDAGPMARLAPTSLVFGVWDSRGTQAKAPRLFASTIRAFNVKRLTRSAQYAPPIRYAEHGLIDEAPDKATRDQLSVRGLLDVPATGTHGGVIAASVRRDLQLHLAALRLLAVKGDAEATLKLRRYVLGLALVAFTAPPASYLRQGCNLIPASEIPAPVELVYANGRREVLALDHAQALAFARAAAADFGVGPSMSVPFERERIAADLGEGKAKKDKKAAKGAG